MENVGRIARTNVFSKSCFSGGGDGYVELPHVRGDGQSRESVQRSRVSNRSFLTKS